MAAMIRFLTAGVLVATLMLIIAPAGRAASVDWDNESGDGSWTNGLNWSINGVPSFPDDATFIFGGAGPANITSIIPVLRDIRFGDDGRSGSGTVNHSAGTAQLNGWFRMGITNGSSGTYNLSGTGNLNVNGRAFIAEQAGTNAIFKQTDGVFNFAAGGTNDGLHIGESGTGIFTLENGLLRQGDVPDVENLDSWNRLGQNAGSSGTFNISGGTASFDARTLVGLNGSGTVNQTGGTVEVRRHQLVVSDTTANGVYNISGGTVQTLQVDRPITVGQWDNSNGQLNVSGTARVISAGNLEIGFGREINEGGAGGAPAQGTVTQTGGTVIINQNLLMGRSSISTGTYNLSGGTLNVTGGIIDVLAGSGTFNFTGGRLEEVGTIQFTLNQQGGVFAPSSLASPGTVTINGDYNLLAAGTLEVSLFADATSDVTQVNGMVSLAGNLDLTVEPGLRQGMSFTIVDNDDALDPITGTFAGRPDDSVFPEDGYFFKINYQGGDGNDVTILVVPEPSSTALALVALAAHAPFSRRRRLSWKAG